LIISGNKGGVIVKDIEWMNNLYRLTDNLGTLLKRLFDKRK